MKKHKSEQQEMRDRRRKQVLKRIQELEWKSEQWQDWAADEEPSPSDDIGLEEDRDRA
jgi:hypothetical protein